ncbi:MAG: plasma-membrane proton-efflux P-type ATPase [Nitrospiraceae bacterium]|nr:plasma-membrane proton-efflux P-type ATPase [Nitrospiraceae bacterium]
MSERTKDLAFQGRKKEKILGTSEYKKLSAEDALDLLETSSGGLTEAEADNRLKKFGPNEITEKGKNPLLEFMRRYWGPMPWLLELAMGLSFLLAHRLEAGIIFALLTLNAVIGHMHSRSSQKAVELLKKKLAIKARVLRDGAWMTTVSREVVPGDVISVKIGDIVPADAKVLDGNLSLDESALTGESLPVEARALSVIYSSSVIKRGEAKCLVVNTGANTYFGRTAGLVKVAKPKSHQEDVIMAVVKYMMYFGIVASVLVGAYAFYIKTGILTIMTFTVIFLMGAVPVALPAVLTIVQAAGAMELARKGALVTRLDSVEDAASIDILCLDKTGTITENKLSVVEVKPFAGHKKEEVAAVAALASREEGMDLIDLAVIGHAAKEHTGFSGPVRQMSYIPFDPSTKRTEAVVESGRKRFRAVKGAAQVVSSMCRSADSQTMELLGQTVDDYSRKGYRTLAVARSMGDDLENLELMGLLAMADPPRPDSKTMIGEARGLGIKPIMLTGDNLAIAREIGLQTGIGGNITRATDIGGLAEGRTRIFTGKIDGFAEIYPEDKYKVVKLLQSGGHMVGMTGDGVNDAPALRQAEMGIAVSGSTDVAKASASVVLTEPGTRVIIDAIKTSRKIYQRMLTWVINKVTKVIEFVGILTMGFLWLHKIVLSLLGMSLLVFANDFVTMSLATDNVEHTASPNKWNIRNITIASIFPGMLMAAGDAVMMLAGIRYFHLGLDRLRTMVMLNLIFNSQFRVLIVRERRHFWSSRPGGQLVFLNVLTIIGFTLVSTYGIAVPSIPFHLAVIMLAFSAVYMLLLDLPKYFLFRKFGL